jgi:hypothetical protein
MRPLRRALALIFAASIAATDPVGASALPTWQSAQIVQLPAGGVTIPQGYLPALACPSAGNCIAAGLYADFTNSYQGLIATEVAGVWQSPTAIVAPSNGGSVASPTPYAASCASVGNCAIVGGYLDTQLDQYAFVDEEKGGAWSTAAELTLPTTAIGSGQIAQLRAVDCPSAGNCVGVGDFLAQGSSTLQPPQMPMVAVEVHGSWSTRAITLPAGASVSPFASLGQVTCASAGNCVATGTYLDVNNVTHGVVVRLSGGVLSPGAAIVLPANASAYPNVTVGASTCVTSGPCVVIGTYLTTRGRREGFALQGANATWPRATMLRMPLGAAVNPRVFYYGFAGLACTSAGNCATGGQYVDIAGHYQGFLISEVGGAWQVATEMALPNGASRAGANGGVVAMTCPAAGTCTAGAAYLDAQGNYQALLLSETNASWTQATSVDLPGSAATVGLYGGIYAVVCASSTSCTATGSYLDNAGNYQGFTVATG